MKYTKGFAALLLGMGLMAPMVVAVASQPEELHHDGRHSLALPATTACLENHLATGRANQLLSGMAATVVLDGRVVYRRGFGTVSPTTSQPALPTTRFRIGSVTKSMTATALLSLAEEGRLDLHAPASELLPGFSLPGAAGWSERLTAHRLLSHQGALTDFGTLNGPRDDGALAAAFYDPAYTQAVQLMVAPGTFYNYSNPNFSLAGLLAETAAGRPYREVIRKRVFKPLGMTRAAFLASEVTADNDIAFGMRGNLVYAPGDYDTAIGRPAGFAWASVDDLAKYMNFILRGNRNVLSTRTWRAMQTRQVNTLELLDIESYGYGLVVVDSAAFPDSDNQLKLYKGVKVVWHGGEIPGYQAVMATLPRQGFGFAAVVNADGIHPGTDPFPCFQVAAIETVGKRLPPPSPFPDLDIQRDRFGDYVGHYSDRINVAGRAIVSLTPGGELRIQFPDFDAIGVPYDPILRPISRDNFVLRVENTNYRLTGVREGGSTVTHLRTRPTVLSRTPASQATLRAAPSIDRRALEQALRNASTEHTTTLVE